MSRVLDRVWEIWEVSDCGRHLVELFFFSFSPKKIFVKGLKFKEAECFLKGKIPKPCKTKSINQNLCSSQPIAHTALSCWRLCSDHSLTCPPMCPGLHHSSLRESGSEGEVGSSESPERLHPSRAPSLGKDGYGFCSLRWCDSKKNTNIFFLFVVSRIDASQTLATSAKTLFYFCSLNQQCSAFT